MPAPIPVAPLPAGLEPGPRAGLLAALARIDGWGPGAWREITGAWRLARGILLIEPRQPDEVSALVVLPGHGLGRAGSPGDAAAICDWALGACAQRLLADAPVRLACHRPGAAVRATNACFLAPADGADQALCLRLAITLPMAGMCCDGVRFARFVRRLERFLAGLAGRAHPGLAAQRRAVAVQQALRAALPAAGLVAFLGAGARLARDAADRPAAGCAPLRVPRALRATLDLGRLGRWTGLGIRQGVTACTGAPYHGKSTLLQAVAAGREDHRPGDGRELVVADASGLLIQAEDGRRIKSQDLSAFFSVLPGGQARAFTSERASGATSMAASLLQGVAAGCRLLLVDEDSAAGNFLSIDAPLRRLLGPTLRGCSTLLDLLPALARGGVSTLLAVGSNSQALAAADRVLQLDRFRPRDATTRARRLVGRAAARPGDLRLGDRVLAEHPDRLLGPRHFLRVEAREPERPLLLGDADDLPLDLRRCGWQLDAAQVRGALCAAAWCCRLAGGEPTGLVDLERRYRALLAEHGVRGLDPFDTAVLTAPPWQLVVGVLERLPGVRIASAAR